MNLRDLRYAVAVADHGHFGRAAAACHVSQPTLSGQILKLEEELQVKIFERLGKSVRPTRVGGDILVLARQVIAAAKDIEATAQASRDPLAGPIRLGVIPTLAPYVMPALLPRAAAELPNAPLVLVEDMTRHVLAQLIEGQLDAVLIATDPEDDRLEQRLLFDDPFLVAMAPGHALAAREAVRVGEIEPGSLLLLADGHCLRDQALAICSTSQADAVSADVRASSLETLLQLVAAGLGVTLVPSIAWDGRKAGETRIVARPIADAGARRRVRMVWRRGIARAAAVEALISVMKAAQPGAVAPC